MKKRVLLLLLSMFLFSAVFPADNISFPGGRYILTSDGNRHDVDDTGATPFTIALLCDAGFSNRIVHIDYNNHLGSSLAGKEADILTSINGAIERYPVDTSIIFNCQTQFNAAKANFLKEAKLCDASNPLWVSCAGPMGTIYIYLEAVRLDDPSKLQYIHCISHSPQNNKHDDEPELSGKTWAAMKIRFPAVNYHDIEGQNTVDGFCAPIGDWSWMSASSAPEKWQWLISRNRTAEMFNGRYDISDAGMTYWLISGANNGGNERPNNQDAKIIFENAINGKQD